MTSGWRHVLATVLGLVLGLVLLAGCGGSNDSPTAATTRGANTSQQASVTAPVDGEPGGAVIVGQDQAPDTLNPMLLAGATLVTVQSVAPVLNENMFTVTPDFQYVPVLATKVPSLQDGDVTEDPFTVTIHIRAEAAWSDGQPVTSADIVFTWQTIMNPRNKVWGRVGWELVTAIHTPDPKTAIVVFERPYGPWKDLFSPSGGQVLLPKHVLEGKDFNTVWNRGGLIGTGPYVIDSYTPGERLVLVPNENYWRKDAGGPYASRIVHVYLKETTTQQIQFESGEVNLIVPPDFSIRRELERVPDATVEKRPGLTWEILQFNVQDSVVGNPDVRSAIAYAVDPEELIAVSTEDETTPLQSYLVPEQAPYFKPVFERYNPDPAMVDRHMTAAGYVKNAGGFYEKDGREIDITFTTIAGNETREKNFRLMKDQLERVGIHMTPRFDPNFFDADGGQIRGEFQVAERAYLGSADPDIQSLFDSSEIPTRENNYSGQNTFRLADPSFDRLLAAAAQTLDEDERVRLVGQVQDYVADNVVLFPLYQRPDLIAYPDNLRNVLVNPTLVSHFDQMQNWFFTGGRASR